MSWMLKSMWIDQRENKGIVKSNFVSSCLAFRGSIPTIERGHSCHWDDDREDSLEGPTPFRVAISE